LNIKNGKKNKKGLKIEYMGEVDSIGWEPSRSGKSTDVYAVVKMKLGNIRKENQKEEAETRINGLKDQLLGHKVQLFVVS